MTEFVCWAVFLGDSDEPHFIEDDDRMLWECMCALMAGVDVEIFGVVR